MVTVSWYGQQDGWIVDMPSLNEGRQGHGCGSYTTSEEDMVPIKIGKNLYQLSKRCQVLIVVGGWGRCDHGCTFLDTTEVFTPGSGPWRILAEALPSPIQGGYVATVYMFGRIRVLIKMFSKVYQY